MKHLIKEISPIVNHVSIRGNFKYIPKNYLQLEAEYRYFLTDREFIEKYFHKFLEDDSDYDYEIHFAGSLVIKSQDNGTINLDWIDDGSGSVNICIGDKTEQSKLLYQFMTDKTKCRWWIDDTNLNIVELN